ncbi:MAG: MATE family efflux transporter [Chitinophagales bacterium]|nr:MATE family efflux transporter [Chitinophagales bacterium]MDW8419744.1 MATE family efflux transporter [Chitinophagales bacterium]
MAQLSASYREILRISTPLILGNLAWTFNGVFDTIFVGNLGKVELDAIGFASVFYSVLFMMGFSFTRGTQILIARSMGELNRRQVGNIFDNTLLLLSAVSLVLFLIIQNFSRELLTLMLNTPEIIDKCEVFLDYRIWGLMPSFITFIFIAFYTGIGKTEILAVSVTIMTVLNIALNYGLVYGKFGLPALGIKGSGMATAISESVAVAVLFAGVFIKNRRDVFALFKFQKIDWSLQWQMARISVPLMIQTLVAAGSWVIFFARIETELGPDPLAVSTIYRQLILFFTIPTWSLGSTANTIVSNLMGQRDYAGVKTAVRKISVVSLSFALLSCLLIMLAPDFFIGVFINRYDSPAILPIAKSALPVIYIIFILMSFSNIVFNGVISIGDILIALGIELVVVMVYLAYFILILRQTWADVWWVWTSEWLYWGLMFLLSWVYFKIKKLEVL